MAVEMIVGRRESDSAIEIEKANSVKIDSKKLPVKTMVDGEVMTMETPLEFSIRPKTLKELAP
jgi:diacylglycerol kinase family enzyme